MKKIIISITVLLIFIVGVYIENGVSTKGTDQQSKHQESYQKPEFELYKGKALRIAVIGNPPEVKENHINFNKISFDDLSSDEIYTNDAVFIMKENLEQAAQSQYADTYLNSPIPFFFISARSHVPFTVKDIEYAKSWSWSYGNSYATGVLMSPKDNSLKYWGYGLYNDKKTEEHIKEVYSRIFESIEAADTYDEEPNTAVAGLMAKLAFEGGVYFVEGNTTPEEKIQDVIGSIKKIVGDIKRNGQARLHNPDFNLAPEAKIYSIKDVDEDTVIAVKVGEKYYTAVLAYQLE